MLHDEILLEDEDKSIRAKFTLRYNTLKRIHYKDITTLCCEYALSLT